MSGSGRGVCGGHILTQRISKSGRVAKTYRRVEIHPVCVRGGAFFNRLRRVRCAYRDWDGPNVRGNSIGFRVVVRPAL